jgi:hypothetical protein
MLSVSPLLTRGLLHVVPTSQNNERPLTIHDLRSTILDLLSTINDQSTKKKSYGITADTAKM